MAGKKPRKAASGDNCFSDALRALLKEKVGEAPLESVKAQAREFLRADMTNDEAIAMALIRKAIEGDAAAAKYICEAARRCEDADGGEKGCFRLTLRVVRGDGD